MFFLLSSFRFCQPLKNDGNGELRFGMVLNDFLYKRNSKECKPSPLDTVFWVEARAKEERIHGFAERCDLPVMI